MKRLVIAAAALAAFGCDRGWNKELPPAGELGSPRGYFVARGTVHLHSPYSHDACDGDGLPGGAVNEGCYQGLREALCLNRMDFAMLTDHPAHMAEYEFEDLLLPRAGDVLVPGAEGPVANEMFCENGARPLVTVGFEDNLMPVGMERHLDPDPVVRNQLYNSDGPVIGARLKDEAGAVLWVPHTESRSIDYLRTLGHQGMEIYQIHANLDPDIRVEWLGLDAFSGIAALIPYLFDAFSAPVPDLAFLSFFYLSPVYAEKWNALTDEGLRIAASVGCDSHQNVLNLQGIDGDRMDAHRRVLRWTSDHYLVTDYTFDAVKESLAAARGWIVFEILGSPVGMDFYADADGDVVGVGETGAFAPGATTIHVPLPTLHPDSPQGGDPPTVKIEVKRVLPGGLDEVVAESTDAPLAFAAAMPGAYRAEVTITPSHLTPYLGRSPELFVKPTPWIVTNHLVLE